MKYEVGETIKFATLHKINKGLHLICSIQISRKGKNSSNPKAYLAPCKM